GSVGIARRVRLRLRHDDLFANLLVLCSDIVRELQALERKLTGPDYPVESVLARLDKLSDVLERGKRGQQKKVLRMLFESVSIDGEGTIKEVELQKWARPLFADLLIVNGDHKCPQGTFNARHVATLAGLKTHSMSIPQPVKSAKPLRATFLHPQSDQSATLTPEAIARNPSLN
ncbi:MAG: hypothetical protein PVI80_06215, partial [Anaerolineae bacterium]